MAGKVSLLDVKNGIASVEDLFKINALLDMQSDIEEHQYNIEKSKGNK